MLIICESYYFDQLKQVCKLKRTNIDQFAKYGYCILAARIWRIIGQAVFLVPKAFEYSRICSEAFYMPALNGSW